VVAIGKAASIFNSGNVGIGTTSPSTTLEVAGGIKAGASPGTPVANAAYGESFAKAWVRFDGTGAIGSQTMYGQFNVSSVNKTSTGNYTINFSTPFGSTNYTAVCNSIKTGTSLYICAPQSFSTSSVAIYTGNGNSGAAYDSNIVTFVAYGLQ
jgi:hypothetical protein